MGNMASAASSTAKEVDVLPATEEDGSQRITLGGGCFWCLEAIMSKTNGVLDATSGYMGGSAADAKYETVCSRDTGHVEVVHVHFDPKKVAGGLRGLLEVFYKAHDPTDGGGQGADRGPQYMGSIWVHSEEQKKEVQALMSEWDKALGGRLKTKLMDAKPFYAAEDYHQKFWDKNGKSHGYCRAVIAPKLAKFGML